MDVSGQILRTLMPAIHIGIRVSQKFRAEVKPTLTLVNYGDLVRAAAEEIFRRRGRQRRLSFCDAISFVVATSLLDNIPCFAFDRDFQALGLTVIA